MTKIAISTNDDNSSVSPTDNQLAAWEKQELAEAEVDNMLGDEDVVTLFSNADDSTSPSID